MDLKDLANSFGKVLPVSKEIKSPTKESVSGELLTELETQKKFKRTDPSMEYKGSTSNKEFVKRAILEKYGQWEAENYQPCVQVKPKTEWLKLGFYPVEDKPLCVIPTRRNGVVVDCDLWHLNQVEEG